MTVSVSKSTKPKTSHEKLSKPADILKSPRAPLNMLDTLFFFFFLFQKRNL